jgi:thiamine pyrophosphate-dependent acetolactate synthase large subunit-like protein
MGCLGIQVRHPSALSSALDRAFSVDKPAVIDVKTHIEGIAPPPWVPG